jgi:hypothetical protein
VPERYVKTGFQEHKDEFCHRCGKKFSPLVGYKVQWAEIRAHLDVHASRDRRDRALRAEMERYSL